MDLKKNLKLLSPNSLKKSDGKISKRSSYKATSKASLSPRTLQHLKRASLESNALLSTSDNTERKSSKNISIKSACLYDKPRLSQSKIRKTNKDKDSSPIVKKKFPESLGEPVHEGSLKSKNTFVDGRYSLDRAWKATYAVLRGHCLCLHPDKNSQNLVVYDHPVSIGSALVDIAYDYTKRSNVFRVMTLGYSEFLFEAPSSSDMLDWIQMLQKQGLVHNQESLRKKIIGRSSFKRHKNKHTKSDHHHQQQQQEASSNKQHNTSTTSSHRKSPMPTASSTRQDLLQPSKFIERFRSRSPEGRKFKLEATAPSIHIEISSDVKSSKSWREKMAERFRRANSHPGTTTLPISSSSSNQQTLLLSPPLLHHHSSFNSDNSNVYQYNVDDEDDDEVIRKKYKGSLGIPLKYCVHSTVNKHLPLIIEVCIDVIESQGLEKKGIYRVPGNNAAISMLQMEVDKDPLTLNRSHEKWNDTNAVVSLLKLFFRKLPEPLVTTGLYQSFIDVNHTEDKTKRLLKLKRLVHMLPPHNFETFRCLATHLNKVSTFEKTNMMDARNLAIIFGPTLFQPNKNDNMVNMVKDMNDQCQVLESIIMHYKWFFGSWDEDVQVPGEDTTSNTPITSMEVQLMEKAQQHCSNLEGSSSSAISSKKIMSKSSNGINNNTTTTAMSSTSSTPTTSTTTTTTLQHSIIGKVKKESNSDNKGMAVYSVESVYCDFDNSMSSDSSKNTTLRSRHYSSKSHLKDDGLRSGVKTRSGVVLDRRRGSTSLRVEHHSRKKSKDEGAVKVVNKNINDGDGVDDDSNEDGDAGETKVSNITKESGAKVKVHKLKDNEAGSMKSSSNDLLASKKYTMKMKLPSDKKSGSVVNSLESLKKPTPLQSKPPHPGHKKVYDGSTSGIESNSSPNPSTNASCEKLKDPSSSITTKHPHKRHMTDRNVERNVCSSGFLQPPRLHFRSRSSQKSGRKSRSDSTNSSKLGSKSISSISDDAAVDGNKSTGGGIDVEDGTKGIEESRDGHGGSDVADVEQMLVKLSTGRDDDNGRSFDDVFVDMKKGNAKEEDGGNQVDGKYFEERLPRKQTSMLSLLHPFKLKNKRSTSIDSILNEIKYFKISRESPSSPSTPGHGNKHNEHCNDNIHDEINNNHDDDITSTKHHRTKFARASLKIHSSLHSLIFSPQRLKKFFHRDFKSISSPTNSPITRRFLSFNKTKHSSDGDNPKAHLSTNDSTEHLTELSSGRSKKLIRSMSAGGSCKKELVRNCLLKECGKSLAAYESSV